MNVVVVGGGVIGLAVAWRAQRAGLTVTVIDPAPASKASHVTAGMLPPGNEQLFDKPELLALCLRSRELIPSFMAELGEIAPAGYRRDGVLDAAFDEEALDSLDRQIALQESVGIPAERLTAEEVAKLQPAFGPVHGGLFSPDEGAVDPRFLNPALIKAVESLGGTLVRRRAVRVADHAVVLDNGESVPFDRLVLAAGPWTHRIEGLPEGAVPEIHPVKGHILRLTSETPLLGVTARAMSKGTSLYLVPRPDGELAIGATYEEVGYDESATASGAFELLTRASAAIPGLGALRFGGISAGFRPCSPDGLPLIGPSTLPDVYLATGHARMGVQLAAVTAETLTAQLTGTEPHASTVPFSPLRLS
ncbi:glycine oxidase ThiO [Streptomyces lonarensis]|uniref:glycine oxidase n=1 Tax=Streptomyces lonarensis TaxID=700599 RepID=A0A7X6HY07_9ACTN|nr:glycine oxidase ThiO [Streptomyces lonarensis]NJQ05131.1 glycine oxidase ThiO [Streptomyces lonarensis]